MQKKESKKVTCPACGSTVSATKNGNKISQHTANGGTCMGSYQRV